MDEFKCIYCGKEVKINEFFLETISNKKGIVVKCGECLLIPYHKRSNLKEAEAIQIKLAMMW